MVDDEQAIVLCHSDDLRDGGVAVVFDVRHAGLTCTAFAIRYRGQPYAYINRCSHVAMELDGRSGRFFDATGRWLLCQVHGAIFDPPTGSCAGGPGRGGLLPVRLSESQGVVRWHTAYNLQPAEF
ncbi:Rieske 2Fe-2S domain-containing protein [Xylophilus sp. Kf1]|nr:Rieske 2Fe-2S domain-containing protein [Xylophilus sp. Kf1]